MRTCLQHCVASVRKMVVSGRADRETLRSLCRLPRELREALCDDRNFCDSLSCALWRYGQVMNVQVLKLGCLFETRAKAFEGITHLDVHFIPDHFRVSMPGVKKLVLREESCDETRMRDPWISSTYGTWPRTSEMFPNVVDFEMYDGNNPFQWTEDWHDLTIFPQLRRLVLRVKALFVTETAQKKQRPIVEFRLRETQFSHGHLKIALDPETIRSFHSNSRAPSKTWWESVKHIDRLSFSTENFPVTPLLGLTKLFVDINVWESFGSWFLRVAYIVARESATLKSLTYRFHPEQRGTTFLSFEELAAGTLAKNHNLDFLVLSTHRLLNADELVELFVFFVPRPENTARARKKAQRHFCVNSWLYTVNPDRSISVWAINASS